MSEQISKVIAEFTKQAEKFNEYPKAFSKEEYNMIVENPVIWQYNNAVVGTLLLSRGLSPCHDFIRQRDALCDRRNVPS